MADDRKQADQRGRFVQGLEARDAALAETHPPDIANPSPTEAETSNSATIPNERLASQ